VRVSIHPPGGLGGKAGSTLDCMVVQVGFTVLSPFFTITGPFLAGPVLEAGLMVIKIRVVCVLVGKTLRFKAERANFWIRGREEPRPSQAVHRRPRKLA